MTTAEATIAARVLRGEANRIAHDRDACVIEGSRASARIDEAQLARDYRLLARALSRVVRRLRTRATRLERGTDNG